MTEYILILGIFFGNGVGVTAILFPSKDACEAAKADAVANFEIRTWWGGQESRARALCAPRYVR